MKTKFSKSFIKSAQKLSGKHKEALLNTIVEVEKAKFIHEIKDCNKLVGFDYIG